METSETEIFVALKNEKQTGELQQLPKDFYKKHQQFQRSSDQESQNASRAINSLREKRTQKILVYIAYGKPIPQPVPQEDEETYNKIRHILKKENADKISTKIKITSNIPEIITPNNNKIGPFKQNEIVELQEQSEIKFIIENKIGEIIQ
jgi:hypothetical protein